MECWCLLRNVTENEDGISSWELTHGKKFDGCKFPFGCLVNFKPSPTRDNTLKLGPKGHVGVFAGYFVAPGLVWDLQDSGGLIYELTPPATTSERPSPTSHK